jgi:hypothetical protein
VLDPTTSKKLSPFNMAYHHQPCDSYFVEEAYPQRATQEYLKMMGRRKQEAMANELSRQACDAYMEDIVKHMQQMEVNLS